MSDIVKQEVRHYHSLRKIAGESVDMFNKLAKAHCDSFLATIDKFDGEHINKCKNSNHPHAKGVLAECLVYHCPLRTPHK